MPVPAIVSAIPWIASGIGSLFSLFGGGKKDEQRTAQDQVRDVQAMLNAFPELRQSLQMQQRQMMRTDPVHQAALQLAMNFAPRSAFQSYPGRPDLSLPQYGGTGAPNAGPAAAASPFPGAPRPGTTRAVPRRNPYQRD